MDKNISLLLDPPHILPPDVVFTQTNIIKCDKCEKALTSKYYIFFGIPPSPLMIEALSCESIDNEKDKEKSVLSYIQREAKDFDIERKNQWIFSEKNMISSKIRICIQCYEAYKWPNHWQDYHCVSNRIRQVFFAVEEYQRRHTPIESAKSEYEKYIISLPDRSHIHWVAGAAAYGIFLDMETNYTEFMWSITDFLKIALIPDCEKSVPETLSQELKADFIKDNERVIPNDHELTRWLKKHFNDHDLDYWYKVKLCKVFTNPKIFHGSEYVYETKYTVVVNYIDGDWDEFDI
jgi:hypothetical protein